MTYTQVLAEVCRVANWLRSQGGGKGDTVAICMPMVFELPIAMLACARIGAVHSVVFGGFSADALADRIVDCQAKVLMTASGAMRGTKLIPLKQIADEACRICQSRDYAVRPLGHKLKYEQPRDALPIGPVDLSNVCCAPHTHPVPSDRSDPPLHAC
jgi:acetyl-CoA synthetase